MPHSLESETLETKLSIDLPPQTFQTREMAGDDRYEVIEGLSLTPTSEVYRAHDWESGQAVALKVYYDETAQAYVRNSHELGLVQELDSDHIISPVEVGEMDHRGLTRRYLATPIAVNGTLGDCRVDGEEEADSVIGYLRDTSLGVRDLHDVGVVHWDIKPGNIFITDSEAVIGDLGTAVSTPEAEGLDDGDSEAADLDPRKHAIARILGQAIVPEGNVVGTKDYMSPEQRRGIVDGRTDVFAIGASAVHVFTGDKPRVYPTATLDGYVVRDHEVRPDRVFVPKVIPEEVVRAVYACLESDPGNRPSNEDLIEIFSRNTSMN